MTFKNNFEETKIFTPESLAEYIADFNYNEEHKELRNTFSNKIKKIAFQIMGRKKYWTPPSEKINGNNIKNVLILRYDALGDYIVSTPLIQWLKDMNPEINIDVVTSYRNDNLVKNDKNIRYTFPVHPAKNFFLSWNQAIKPAKKNDYDVIFALSHEHITKSAYFASKISKHSENITFMHFERRSIYGLVFGRQTYHYPFKEHWIDTNLRAGRENIFFPNDEPRNIRPYVHLSNNNFDSIKETIIKYELIYHPNNSNSVFENIQNMEEVFIDGSFPYCIINLSAFSANRQLSPDIASTVCKELIKKSKDIKIFVTGGPEAKENIEKTVTLSGSPRCIPLNLKFTDFIAFMAGAKFIISPDTSTVHVASAVNIPVIGLYAEMKKIIEWHPYSSPFVALLSKDKNTINAIEPNNIIEGIDILSQRNIISL